MNKNRCPKKRQMKKFRAPKMAIISQKDVKTASQLSNLTCQPWALLTLTWNIKDKVQKFRSNKFDQLSWSGP